MILDTGKYLLINKKGKDIEEYKIAESEMKFFRLMIDNNVHTHNEIKKTLKLTNSKFVRIYVRRIRNKIPKLEIISIRGVGYVLRNVIKVR